MDFFETDKNRPKLKPNSTLVDKWIEGLALTILAALWFWVSWKYASLPETIPTHYTGAGKPDAFGSKEMIFTLPGIATALFVFLSIINRFPHKFNYSVKITPENAAAQYANAMRMMRVLKCSITLISFLIAFQTVRTAAGETTGLGWWFMLLVLGLIVGPMIYFLNRSYRKDL